MNELITLKGISAAALVLMSVATVCSIIFHTFKNGISPMPSSWKAGKAAAELLAGEMETGSIAELGSGWGTMLSGLTLRLPRCTITGYENSPVPFLFSRLLLYAMRRTQVRIFFRSFYDTPLGSHDAVICYLYPGAMEKLRPKFEQELMEGSIVISNTFAVPGWVPEKTVILNDLYRTPLYLYRVGNRHSSTISFTG